MSVKQRSKSLNSRKEALADTQYQLQVLNQSDVLTPFRGFEDRLSDHGYSEMMTRGVDVLQVNIGKLCNQSCGHCHVDAGPDRTENMSREILEQCLKIVEKHNIITVDITGGAPEMNPHFRWFIASVHKLGAKIINRCNLTIIVSNKKYNDLPQFFKDHQVHLISSLPHFSKIRTDAQRGEGAFEDSIKALKMLNQVGYGLDGSNLKLDLVFNPTGAFLPGNQHTLEQEYKRQLHRKFGLYFNQLYAITNLPVSRFLDFLIESGNYVRYMDTLIEAFNPATLDGVMCREMISVSWDGYLYDCDFNQMLDLKVNSLIQHIADFDMEVLRQRKIVMDQHCFGCTAGSGSSCGGEIV